MPDTPQNDAAWLVDLIADGGAVTFLTFDDAKLGRKGLTRVLHGSLAEHADTLTRLNERGAGVYFMVNGGDGKGRKAANVKTVRALFVDLDGAPLQPVLVGPLKPHVTVESSPGRFHAYWLVTGVALDEFTPLQAALARMFNGDPKVKDLPRVMRLPGYLHMKATPFPCRLTALEKRARYSAMSVRRAFLPAPVESPAKPERLPSIIPEGDRNNTLFGLARGLVNKGYNLGQVSSRLQKINATRCAIPLCASEVDAIVVSACEYGSQGYIKLPHTLVDSPEWRDLPHPARSIVTAAMRRFNGSNDGDISLPYEDFRDEFGNKLFYKMRAKAVKAGFLRVTRKCSYSKQGGKLADLFGLGVQTTLNGVSK